RCFDALLETIRRMTGSRRSAALAAFCLAMRGTSARAQSPDAAVAPPFAAVLQVGFVAASPGGYTGQPPDTPSDGLRSLFARVEAEPPHLGVGGGWNASLGFQLGWVPLLRMSRVEG